MIVPDRASGGPKTSTLRQALEMVRGAMDAGANGMFIGRNVFRAPDPARLLVVMRRIIHEDVDVDSALAELEGGSSVSYTHLTLPTKRIV